ncbi:MAG: hypothetical protein HY084_07505 [Gemmatimonadetes bacterium]|nr:hypothetical protein [Gemmatimonadota bacterium]
MRRTIVQGLTVGFIAYLSVAAFYAAFDFLAARGTLYTVDLLGKAVFRGLRDPSVLQHPIDIDMGAVMAYNALHFVVSLAIGLAVCGFVELAERRPRSAPFVSLMLAAGFLVTVAVVGLLSDPIRPLVPWWSVVVANLIPMLFAGWYLVRQRPGVVRLLTRWTQE